MEKDGDDVTAYGRLLADRDGFAALADLLEREAGIPLALSEKNLTLMAGRLGKVLAVHGCSGYRELHALIRKGDEKARRDFLSAMTTHTTQFFREATHFQFLESHLPELLKCRAAEGRKELRVWSAAASTGEEVWSLAMTLSEILDRTSSWAELLLLGTDIDTNALARGARALYPRESLSDVPPALLEKYFVKGVGPSAGFFRVRRALRAKVTFAQFNLQQATFPFQHGFDVIFCRNVFIYFDAERVRQILLNMESVLRPGGYLFVGHSEAIVGFRSATLRKVAPAVFVREGSPSRGICR